MPTLTDLDLDGISHRIINGTETSYPFPYQLQLKYETVYGCGAILISPSFALSAEHCFGGSIKQYQMVAGAYHKYGNDFLGGTVQQMRYLKKVTQLNPKNSDPKGIFNPDIVIIQFDR